MTSMAFTVPGNPRSWKRAARRFGHSYVDADSAAYRNLVALAAERARPAVWMRDARFSIRIFVNFPTRGRADLDNIAKQVCDALNGIVWADDSQVDRLFVERGWNHHEPGVSVEVLLMADPPPKPKKPSTKKPRKSARAAEASA